MAKQHQQTKIVIKRDSYGEIMGQLRDEANEKKEVEDHVREKGIRDENPNQPRTNGAITTLGTRLSYTPQAVGVTAIAGQVDKFNTGEEARTVAKHLDGSGPAGTYDGTPAGLVAAPNDEPLQGVVLGQKEQNASVFQRVETRNALKEEDEQESRQHYAYRAVALQNQQGRWQAAAASVSAEEASTLKTQQERDAYGVATPYPAPTTAPTLQPTATEMVTSNVEAVADIASEAKQALAVYRMLSPSLRL